MWGGVPAGFLKCGRSLLMAITQKHPQAKNDDQSQKSHNQCPPKSKQRYCEAYIKRTQSNCGKPTVPQMRVCSGHGGLSTGPRTPEGRQRMAASKTKHGRETRALRQLRSLISHELRVVEERMFRENLIHGPRTKGRKPSLWRGMIRGSYNCLLQE
jgi:hypothetical protein